MHANRTRQVSPTCTPLFEILRNAEHLAYYPARPAPCRTAHIYELLFEKNRVQGGGLGN